jgi:hypothetical protein
MVFKQANSWKERGLQLQAIKDKCNEILQTLNKPENDARAKGMIHVRQICNTIGAVPIKLLQNAEIPNNVQVILQLLGLTKEKDLQSILSDFNSNSKASFITMVQFVLENCIMQVIESTGEKPAGKFYKDAKHILHLCKIEQLECKLEIIILPAYIRNTLHANGVHKWPSKTIILDGEEYKFEKDKRVNCGSWSHMFHAVFHSLGIYEEIFKSDEISRIQYIPSR